MGSAALRHFRSVVQLGNHDLGRFLVVGGCGYLLDVAVFNLLQTPPLLGNQHPVLARTLAVAAAIGLNYLGNSRWTWAQRRGPDRRREIALFFVFSVIGFGFSLGSLLISRYLLGFDSRLADNVSANVVGLGLGTAFRYVAYQRFVFTSRSLHIRVLASWRTAWALPTACLLAVAARIPALRAPLSPDEGGFLMVAAQWHPGRSLYGNYWVDRPPLLLDIFAVAATLGGALPLRVIGMVAACAVILLSALLCRQLAVSATPVVLAVAGLVSTELLDSFQTSGELLAIPWVLAGILFWLMALQGNGTHLNSRRAIAFATGSGAAGAAAVLIKQNFIGVFVFILVWAVVASLRGRRAGLLPRLAAVTAGALVATSVVLAGAASRGTSLLGVWDAVVLFRAQAGEVIARSASAATAQRLDLYPVALLATGMIGVLCLFLLTDWRHLSASTPVELPVATGALLAWETSAVLLGGSYWLHYLLGLIPGLGLAMIVVSGHQGWRRRGLRWVSGWVATSAAVAAVGYSILGAPVSASTAAGEWLAAHERPGDTAMVAFGQPNILQDAGLSSPYPQLWSLPVRVRDPHLKRFTHVLKSRSAPTWVLVHGSLTSWGIDPTQAEATLRTHYRVVGDTCGWRVFLRNDVAFPAGKSSAETTCASLSPKGLLRALTL
jgi:putative flippase GtrA